MTGNKSEIYKGFNLKSIRELIKNTATLYPNNLAYRYRKDPKDANTIDITYSIFYNDIANLDTSLLDLGLEGKKVVLIGPNRYEWCVSYMAISLGNMTIVPLDYSLPPNEIESLVIRSKAEAVIFDEKYMDTFVQIKNSGSSNLSHFICMDTKEDKDTILSYSKLIQKGKDLIDTGSTAHEDVKVDTSKVSVMLFTSRYDIYFQSCYADTR